MKTYQFEGITKKYFLSIMQYIYADAFFIAEHNLKFFLELLGIADYFMLDRLKAICAFYASVYLDLKNVTKAMETAQSHNSVELERYCLRYLSLLQDEELNQS